MGLVVYNVGGDVRYVRKDEELPSSVVGSLAIVPAGGNVTLSIDIEDPQDDFMRYRLGGEYWASQILAGRLGEQVGA